MGKWEGYKGDGFDWFYCCIKKFMKRTEGVDGMERTGTQQQHNNFAFVGDRTRAMGWERPILFQRAETRSDLMREDSPLCVRWRRLVDLCRDEDLTPAVVAVVLLLACNNNEGDDG